MRYDGYNGAIEVGDGAMSILREGAIARLTFGKDVPPRVIPLAAVAQARLQPATRLKNGFVQVVLAGEEAPELSGAAVASCSNLVLFTHKSNEAFASLHGWLEHVAERNHNEGLLLEVPDLYASNKDSMSKSQLKAAEFQEARAQIKDKRAEISSQQSEKLTTLKANYAATIAKEVGLSLTDAIFTCQSHDDGRNAVVALFADRIERAKPKKFTAISNAAQDVEMTPVRSVSSVQTSKDGFRTKVTVFASGNNIEFRFSHDDAARFKSELQKLMLQGPVAPAVPAPAPATVDVADQLAKFAALKQQGFLTDDEFAVQKAKLLGL